LNYTNKTIKKGEVNSKERMNMGDNQTKNKIIIVEFKKIASFVMNILHEIIWKKLFIKVIKQKKKVEENT
jgi:hypothetical protein